MSRKRHADDSWRAWGEYRKERSRLKDFEDHKQEALEDRMSSVFIIVNEWIDIEDNEGSEVVGSKYFESESEAWDALQLIAESYSRDLPHGETNFVMENHASHLQYEEYYIQELTHE